MRKQRPLTQLRAERLRRALSMEEVCEATGISHTTLQRMETGDGDRVDRGKARTLYKFYDGAVDLAAIFDPMFEFEEEAKLYG